MQYTVIDRYGAVQFELQCSREHLAANIPDGCSYIEGAPQVDWWDGSQWRSKPVAPSRYHTWDWGTYSWQDLRTPEQKAADVQAELDAAWKQVRAQRDRLLAATDWRVIKAQESGQPLDAGWQAYRQALRDITQQPDPAQIVWPDPPQL